MYVYRYMEGQPPAREAFAIDLGARTAVCLGRLCYAAIGEHCGLIGVEVILDNSDPTAMDVERTCSVEDVECPGTFLILDAANEAIAQMSGEQN